MLGDKIFKEILALTEYDDNENEMLFLKLHSFFKLAHRLQHRTACNTALSATPNRPLNPKWPMGSGKRLNLRLFDPPINFC